MTRNLAQERIPPSTSVRHGRVPHDARISRKFSKAEVTDRLQSAVILAFRNVPNGRKLAARAADTTERAAEDWLARKSGISASALINLANGVPEFRAEIRRLLHMEQELDPDFQRALAAFTRAYYEGKP